MKQLVVLALSIFVAAAPAAADNMIVTQRSGRGMYATDSRNHSVFGAGRSLGGPRRVAFASGTTSSKGNSAKTPDYTAMTGAEVRAYERSLYPSPDSFYSPAGSYRF